MAPGTVWTAQEDEELRQLVREHGEKKWTFISSVMGSRKSSKQCRRRWLNHLNMKTKKCGWAPEEDQLLLSYHEQMGNKWTEIARIIGGRTDNAVKNRYHALVRRDVRGGTNSDDSSGHSCHDDQRRLHGSQLDDARSMDKWKSSLEKLRSWIRGRPKSLEDAVERAIKAVDDDSETNDMDTDPNPCPGTLRMGGLQQQQWSALVTENPEMQSSSDSYGTEDKNELHRFGCQLGLIDIQDSSSAELRAEAMDIESAYSPDISMDDGYGIPQSENSSKSSSSDGFAYSEPFGLSSGYSQEYLQEGAQFWLMKGNHTNPGYYTSWVSPSVDAHVSEYLPCASAGAMWHQVDHPLMQ